MQDKIELKSYINNTIQMLTKAEFTKEQIPLLELLQEHILLEIEDIECGLVIDEYMKDIELKELNV